MSKKWGDRKDGKLLRKIDSMHYIMPLMYPNRCDIKCLDSFSSHMQYEQLMNYYTNLANNGCDVIWLVHGDKHKLEFKKELEERISRISKTTKIVATNRETVARI